MIRFSNCDRLSQMLFYYQHISHRAVLISPDRPIASSGRSIPVFLGKPTPTCDVPGEGGSGLPAQPSLICLWTCFKYKHVFKIFVSLKYLLVKWAHVSTYCGDEHVFFIILCLLYHLSNVVFVINILYKYYAYYCCIVPFFQYILYSCLLIYNAWADPTTFIKRLGGS